MFILDWLNCGCIHKWKIYNFKQYFDLSYNRKTPKTQFILQCKKCGTLKEKIISGWLKDGN